MSNVTTLNNIELGNQYNILYFVIESIDLPFITIKPDLNWLINQLGSLDELNKTLIHEQPR